MQKAKGVFLRIFVCFSMAWMDQGLGLIFFVIVWLDLGLGLIQVDRKLVYFSYLPRSACSGPRQRNYI